MVRSFARTDISDGFTLGAPHGLGGTPLSLPNTPLFGTDGIRGRAGDLLTAPLGMQVGYWAGQVL